MMHNLRVRQSHINQQAGNFPKTRKLSVEAIDYIIDKEERRVSRRRTLCSTCMTYTSTSGSCFC